MTTYISILRGINVSGKKLIKMEALRQMYEGLGFRKVRTYVQSGNVVFAGKQIDLNKLEEKISKQINTAFGFDVPVIVLTVDKLKKIINENPFLKDAKKDLAFFHITFLASKPEAIDKKQIEEKIQGEEAFHFSDDAIYLFCPNGYGNTKLHNNYLESKLKVRATTRNWKTTKELLRMGEEEK